MIDSSGRDQDILAWWRHESPDFPHLSKMARQFLSAPASFAIVERLFSSASKMHDDLKKNTTEETLESHLIVGLNLLDAYKYSSNLISYFVVGFIVQLWLDKLHVYVLFVNYTIVHSIWVFRFEFGHLKFQHLKFQHIMQYAMHHYTHSR